MFLENLCKSKIKAGVFWKAWDVGRGEQGVTICCGTFFIIYRYACCHKWQQEQNVRDVVKWYPAHSTAFSSPIPYILSKPKCQEMLKSPNDMSWRNL